jgi:hypothetical protein
MHRPATIRTVQHELPELPLEERPRLSVGGLAFDAYWKLWEPMGTYGAASDAPRRGPPKVRTEGLRSDLQDRASRSAPPENVLCTTRAPALPTTCSRTPEKVLCSTTRSRTPDHVLLHSRVLAS